MPTLLCTLSGQEKRKKSYGEYIHHMLSQLKQIGQNRDIFLFYVKLNDHSNGKFSLQVIDRNGLAYIGLFLFH